MSCELSCELVRSRLHDGHDTGLSEADLLRRQEHLESCADCRAAWSDWQHLQAEIRALPREIEPDADLWSVLQQRLSEPAGASPWSLRAGWLVAAALAVVAVGLSLWLGGEHLWVDRAPGRSSAVAAAERQDAAAERQDAAGLARWEDHVVGSRKDLVEALAWRQEHLSPELATAIAADVEALDVAVGDIRLALQQDPENRQLSLLLAATYQREVDLLRRLEKI